MKIAWYDTEPEEVALLARWWWFGSMLAAVCIFLGALAIGFFGAPEVLQSSDETDSRAEQKLLDKKALNAVIKEYEMRRQKSENVERVQ